MIRTIILCGIFLCVGVGCIEQPAHRARVYSYGLSKPAIGSLGIHTFRKGDTLWSVANAYQVDLRDMLDLNKLSAPYNIALGQRLRIPSPLNYRVHRGDSLYKVSRMFDTTTTELVRLNALPAPYVLNDGQMIKLPSKRVAIHAAKQETNTNIQSEELNPTLSSPSSEKIEREELVATLTPTHKTSDTSLANTKPAASSSIKIVSSGQGFLKPVAGKVISGFGPKADGLHNDGINIKAARGDAVRAADNGEVVYSGNQIEGFGNLVLVRHANGYMTAYAHMDKNLVQKGTRVKRGETIGTVGKTGNVSTPQLHFEIRKGRDAINPQKYLS